MKARSKQRQRASNFRRATPANNVYTFSFECTSRIKHFSAAFIGSQCSVRLLELRSVLLIYSSPSLSLSFCLCLSWFLVPCSLVVPRSSARLIHYDSSYFRQWNPLPSASVGLSLPFSLDNQKVSSSNAAHFSLDVQTPSFFALSTVPSIFAVTTAPFLPTFSFFVAVYLVSSRSSRFRAPSSFRFSSRFSLSASVSTFCPVFDPRDSVPPRWRSSSDSRPISISIIARELPASFGCGLRTVFEDVSASVTSNRSYLFRCLDLQRPPTISHLFATVFFPPRLSPFPPPSFPFVGQDLRAISRCLFRHEIPSFRSYGLL